MLRILVGSPLAGKCLSTEQVVASILPDNAAAQTHVLEALCEEGIKSEMLRLQGKVRAELFPLCLPPCVLLSLPHPGSSDRLSFELCKQTEVNRTKGRSWTAESGGPEFQHQPWHLLAM